MKRVFAIAVHGGAGGLPFWGMTNGREEEYKSGLKNAIKAGYEVLEKGGSAVDAVEIATRLF